MKRTVSAENREYVRQRLSYSRDRLIDEDSNAIMMGWEPPIMRESARTICSQGGDVLNIGFGMGLVDTQIQRLKPRAHSIIEAHPDVQAKMLAEGWGKKRNVTLHFDFWQNVVKQLPAFNGIYWDTWWDTEEQFEYLVWSLKKILRHDGVFSWFNHPENQDLHRMVKRYGFDLRFHRVRVRAIRGKDQGELQYYDSRYKYYRIVEARRS